jgi:hypothetical protein
MSVQMLRVFAIRILSGVAAALAMAGPGQAGVIVQGVPFSIAGNLANIRFAAFDPSLGVLDKVDVSITGTLSFTMQVLPGQTVAPIVAFDANGITRGGFDFLNDAFLYLPQVTVDACDPLVPCGSVIVPFATTFSLSFDLTSLSDLGGIVVADTGSGISPPVIDARRADFIEGAVPIPIIEAMIFKPFVFTPLGGYAGGGSLIATYYYTPTASAGEPGGGTTGGSAAVSEPATVALLALAPGLLLLRRRAARRSEDAT